MLVTLMTAARIIFSMARDGLLPEWAACVHPKTHTQFFATISAGVLAAIPTLFVDITSIADLTSMGNLMGFTGVCFCLMILRLQEELDEAPKLRFGVVFTSMMTIAMSLGVGGATLSLYDFPIWVTITITALLVVLPMASVCAFFWILVPRTREKSTFLCPLVPLVPMLGIAVNMFMTFNFSLLIWILLIIWVFIGTVIYFIYSIRRSNAPSY
jgi:amino acid transporter